jgi:TolA-binding protein
MKKSKFLNFIPIVAMALVLSSCLKTRSDISEQDQTYAYSKKNADNQTAAQAQPSQLNQEAPVQTAALDDKDELIRELNGRVETLENQLAALIKEKESATSQDSQKIVLLQEALTKMQGQIDKLENPEPVAAVKPADKNLKSSDDVAAAESKGTKKLNAYEAGQQNFTKQEWKKAILNFQKYTDESPKGKNVADSKYKIGICFQELGMKEEAMAFYEEVVANFGKTEAGKKSKLRLSQLTKSKK